MTDENIPTASAADIETYQRYAKTVLLRSLELSRKTMADFPELQKYAVSQGQESQSSGGIVTFGFYGEAGFTQTTPAIGHLQFALFGAASGGGTGRAGLWGGHFFDSKTIAGWDVRVDFRVHDGRALLNMWLAGGNQPIGAWAGICTPNVAGYISGHVHPKYVAAVDQGTSR